MILKFNCGYATVLWGIRYPDIYTSISFVRPCAVTLQRHLYRPPKRTNSNAKSPGIVSMLIRHGLDGRGRVIDGVRQHKLAVPLQGIAHGNRNLKQLNRSFLQSISRVLNHILIAFRFQFIFEQVQQRKSLICGRRFEIDGKSGTNTGGQRACHEMANVVITSVDFCWISYLWVWSVWERLLPAEFAMTFLREISLISLARNHSNIRITGQPVSMTRSLCA